jgi:cyclopropane-fatty-acyl-phospholipid synthase
MGVNKSESIIRELFNTTHVEIGGKNPWDIQVHNSHFYQRVLSEAALGLGESYMDGWWDCPALDKFFYRLCIAKLEKEVTGNIKILLHGLRSKVFNLQKKSRAFEVGERHYDLGNDFYQAMLDKRLNYTCAYWKNVKTLDEAQEAKLDLVCRKINIIPGMRILELGCGWGSFAKYAAEKYGAEVTGLTVSRQQVELGQQLCEGLPVNIRLQDYRDIDGKYDAVISIGIMEHVGYKNYRTYMEVADRCLEEDGIAFVHTIARNESSTTANPFTTKYIFPNGMLPSVCQLSKSMEQLFVIEDLHNIGPDYDKTLLAWNENFENAWPELKNQYDQRFYRMWRYYLLSSAGGFRSRDIQLYQFVMTKPGRPQPVCRFS